MPVNLKYRVDLPPEYEKKKKERWPLLFFLHGVGGGPRSKQTDDPRPAEDRLSVTHSERMVKAIRNAGGNARLTLYPDAQHDSWTQTYENSERYAWLLKKRRK